MKKLWIPLLCLLFAYSFSGCGNNPTNQIEESKAEETESQLVTEESSASTPESSKPEQSAENESNILIVYFSRWGNTEYPNDVDATTPAYPTDFDELWDLNHSEMAENYLPALVESNLDTSRYDTVFIGYPVWATEVPQAVLSFLNEYDLTGKTVVPFCTHDGYGAGGSYETIREASHAAESPDGLAVEAKDVLTAENTVAAWLEEIGIRGKSVGTEMTETAITITIGDIEIGRAHV